MFLYFFSTITNISSVQRTHLEIYTNIIKKYHLCVCLFERVISGTIENTMVENFCHYPCSNKRYFYAGGISLNAIKSTKSFEI